MGSETDRMISISRLPLEAWNCEKPRAKLLIMARHSIAIQIGLALRARRRAAGMRQDPFADDIDMEHAYYAAIERGEKKITLKMLKQVADGLRVPISEILRDIVIP